MSCNCWQERDNGLRERFGLKISDACSALMVIEDTLDLRGAYGLSLQRVDGKKPKRKEPKFLEITHCPFCGEKYEEAKAKDGAGEVTEKVCPMREESPESDVHETDPPDAAA